MKIQNQDGSDSAINPSFTWNPRKEIEYIKKALKQDHLYTDAEIKHLKSRLRDMYIVNKQMKRGPGFGRAS